MNYEWIEKTNKKKIQSKNEKETEKIKVKLPHVNKNSSATKRIFVQTTFSHSIVNLELKHFTLQTHSFFGSTSSFDMAKITTPIWLQKS